MDLQLLSCQSSPLSNVLSKDASLEPFIYNLEPSLPLISRQKIELPLPSSAKFGGKCSVKLPRYGLLNMLLLNVAFSSNLVTGRYKHKFNFGHMLVKKASLMTNSRAILELYAVENLHRALELNQNARDIVLSTAGDASEVSTASTTAPATKYIPLLFECFKKSENYLDLAFMEELTLEVEFETTANLFIESTAWLSGEKVSIDYDNSSVLAYYVSMSDSDLRKYENANFSIDAPLSMLYRSSYAETTQSLSGTISTQTSFNIAFNCPNLIEKTIITVYKNTTTGKVGDFAAIDKLEYYIGGRMVYTSKGKEELLENSIFFSSGLGAIGVTTTALNENLYVHYWNLMGGDTSRCSGFVSGKNASNFSVKVYFTPDETATYYCDAIHSIAQVVSISGTSGKCSVSLSV